MNNLKNETQVTNNYLYKENKLENKTYLSTLILHMPASQLH